MGMRRTEGRLRAPSGNVYEYKRADPGFLYLLPKYRQDLGVKDDKMRVPLSLVEHWEELPEKEEDTGSA